MTDTHHPPQDPRLVGHETSDAEIGPLLKFAVFLTIVVVIVSLLTMGLYSYLDAREQAEKAPRYPLSTAQRPLPPTPRLQTHPFMDVQQLRREEARFLTRYSWVDRDAGVVRIPVDRAIEVLAERGLPHREARNPEQPEAAPQR
ncbi:MAG TPA: hypothetical protein VIL25_10200 [Vicinamibacterales bacterium]